MTVVALSGRRIDAPGTTPPRFPAANIDMVRERIRAALERLAAGTLVCSAACGADQLALEVAGALGLRRRVILPFAESKFRQTSVIDRGAEWGAPFDRTMAELRASNGVVTLKDAGSDADSYTAANDVILDEAEALGRAGGAAVVAMLVAERESAYDGIEDSFAHEAKQRAAHDRLDFDAGMIGRAGLTARDGSPACRAVLRWSFASILRGRSRRARPVL